MMKLTLQETARCLDLPANTIERWIRQGSIPMCRDGVFCRFNPQILEKWAQAHNLNFVPPHQHPQAKPKPRQDTLCNVMQRGGVYYELEAHDSESALKAGVDCLHGFTKDIKSELYQHLLERERLTSTGIGRGVAIPHPRSPLETGLNQAMIATCFLAQPLPFQAVDDMPVFVMFLLISPSIRLHLHLLSRLAYCLREIEFVDFLRTAPPAEELFQRISLFEAQLEKTELI